MDNIKKIIALGLTFFSITAYAEICDSSYQSQRFFMAIIVNDVAGEGVGCFYGGPMNDISYTKLGKYAPLRGPWEKTNNPNGFGCFPIPGSSADCEFELKV